MLRIVIPARQASSRLPDKMIQMIGRKPLIEHAVDRVLAAADGTEVLLATDSEFVGAKVAHKVRVVMTPSDCRSGSDRCAAVADIEGWSDNDVIVDVQADMPFLRPSHLRSFLKSAATGDGWDILTGYCDVPAVEVLVRGFNRIATLCHVGLYAFRRDVLRRFAALDTSRGEAALRLEQMRAVDNDFRIAFHALPEMPFEVNTPQDLAAAQHLAECLG